MNFFITTPARRHLRAKETAETVMHVIKEILAPRLIGQDPLDVDKIHSTMELWISEHRSAKAAIETAVYDIAGKYARCLSTNTSEAPTGRSFRASVACPSGGRRTP